MFLARVHAPAQARRLGLFGTAMAVPLSAAALLAATSGLGAWDIALPLVFVGFGLVEVVVDVILPVDVRSTSWLWLYLASFYLAQWALIGAAYRIGDVAGAAVLVTYFVCLAATAYSYRRVGHGGRRRACRRSRP